MNTPAHVILSALSLGRGSWRTHWLAITLGALMPDLPMFGFYFYQRIFLGRSEGYIWSQAYFDPAWQAFFDVFNSLPLIALGALVAWRLANSAALTFLLSMAVHCVADLPLHNDDAHAHFFPFSSWRFESPVSYWDPDHFGLYFIAAEMLLVIVGSFYLLRPRHTKPWRSIGGVTLGLYAALAVFALLYWVG